MRTLETEQEKKERKNKKQKRTALKARKMSCINKNEVYGISKHSAGLSCRAQKNAGDPHPSALFISSLPKKYLVLCMIVTLQNVAISHRRIV